jgi:sentrin-specific protease 7
LEKVFASARKSAVASSQNRPAVKEEPSSISVSERKARSKAKPKEPSTRGSRVIDQLDNDDAESGQQVSRPKKTSSIPNKTQSSAKTILDLTGPEFYGKSSSENKPQAARSSTRLKDEVPPSRRHSPGEIEWTRANPEWTQLWKSSIVYPPKGRDKATIDAEDIERLDEGNYLNDNLIEFYMRWLERHVTQDKQTPAGKRIYIMNTFFYERLTTNKNGKRFQLPSN